MAHDVKRMACEREIIGRLPDDILVEILSHMDTKAATATSILSSRWRYLHTLLPRFHLSLDTKTLRRPRFQRRLYQKLVAFLNIFHGVANPQTHRNMTSLVVEFDYFSRKLKNLLTQCIEVALSGKLEHFEILNQGVHYDFPAHLLSNRSGSCLQSLAISNCYITTPLGFCKFGSLRKLSLFRCALHSERNNVGQQCFEVLLHSCSSLETLSMEYSTILPLLIIKAPNQLKELTINHCRTDGIQIIHAPRLEKLECFIKCPYFGSERCKLSVATVTSLKHFRLGFEYYPYRGMSSYTLEKLTKTAPHLETLILCFEKTVWIDSKSCNVSFLNLRHLVLVEGETWDLCSTFWIFLLLKSAPLLESLEIDLNRENYWRASNMPSDFSHDNLKVLIIKGYQGEYMEFEINLILFLLNGATRLEKVIISFDAGQSKQWIITEKIKILERIGGGVDSNIHISFI